MTELHRLRLIAFTAVVLIGCDGSSGTSADATSVAPIEASAVTYDNTASGLAASHAQAAFDELNTALTGARSLAVAAEQSAASNTGRVAQLEAGASPTGAAFDAVEGRVAGLETAVTGLVEAGLPSAEDVDLKPVTGLAASDVQAAFAALVTRLDGQDALIAAQAARIEALEAFRDASLTCPADTTSVGAWCVEQDARSPSLWSIATGECAFVGRTLCPYGALRDACDALLVQAAPEWTSTWLDVGKLATVDFDLNQCSAAFTAFEGDLATTSMPYRCCAIR